MRDRKLLDLVEDLRYVVATRLVPTMPEYKMMAALELFEKILTNDIILVDRTKIEKHLVDNKELGEKTIWYSKELHLVASKVFDKNLLARAPINKEHLNQYITEDFINGFERELGYSLEEEN